MYKINKSLLGYSMGSPYQNDPFIDIFTPEGLIDMSNTPKDLIGIDNKGNKKKMKAFSKNPYKFEGDIVREFPANPYMQRGGIQELFSYLFEDDDLPNNTPTAPSVEEVEQETYKSNKEREENDLAMQIAMEEFSPNNPYNRDRGEYFPPANLEKGVNPYLINSQNYLMSKFNIKNLGVWGDNRHKKLKSDHNTGDAQDFSFDKPETADAAISELMNNYKEKNIKYIIYNGKIWNPSISMNWRPYLGKNSHKTHFHVSYNR